MIGDAELHRRGDPQSFMHSAKIVVHDIEGDSCPVVFKLLAKGIRQSGEPPLRHPQADVLPFDVACADMARPTNKGLAGY